MREKYRLNLQGLDRLYRAYNRREFVHPDPLEFLYRYPEVQDREIAALIASSLAYGRVRQILKSVSSVLDRMGPSPRRFVERTPAARIGGFFYDFKHRFTGGSDMADLIVGIKGALVKCGSLDSCFSGGYEDGHENIVPALAAFVEKLQNGSAIALLSHPSKGSACKRLNLFLRWMVRQDDVDPGGWRGISPSKLIVPLDTHMHKTGLALGMTSRRQADMRTAIEITRAFAKFSPGDPAKYDFCLTRLGIRGDVDHPLGGVKFPSL